VRVVAPDAEAFPEDIELVPRNFQDSDLTGAFLVVAATNSPELNRHIASVGKQIGTLVNVADQPALGDVTVPAQTQVGDRISLAVTTHGDNAALAALIKQKMVSAIEPEWSEVARLLGDVRAECHAIALSRGLDSKTRAQLWREIVALPLVDWIRAGRANEIRTAALNHFARSYFE
jgi:precorrin-2 dehydrogenase/sirohydrochlorin ferrochelatase